MEGHDPILGEHHVPLPVGPVERGRQGSLVLAALDRAHLFQHHLAALGRLGVTGLVVPEVDSIDAFVREPDAALVRMVLLRLLLFGHLFHGPRASHVSAGCGAHRPEIRLRDFLTRHVEGAVWLAADLDFDFVGAGRNLDLCRGVEGQPDSGAKD